MKIKSVAERMMDKALEDRGLKKNDTKTKKKTQKETKKIRKKVS